MTVGERVVPESAWRLRKAKSVIKLLALAPDRRMHRDRARELHLGLLLELAEHHASLGDAAGAVEALQRAVVDDPLHEEAHRRLMRLFAEVGRRQQALAQYQQLRQTLRREYEADPDPETRRLFQDILAGRFAPVAPTEAPTEARPPGARRGPAKADGGLRHNLP